MEPYLNGCRFGICCLENNELNFKMRYPKFRRRIEVGFTGVRRLGVTQFFVDQDGSDLPVDESLRANWKYLSQLSV